MPTAQSYFFNGRQDYMSTAGYGLQCSRLSTANAPTSARHWALAMAV